MFKKGFLIALLFLSGLVFWEWICQLNMISKFVLPSPSTILLRIFERPDRFWFHSRITLVEMLAALALTLILAFPLAWMMAAWTSLNTIFQSLFIFIQCIPMFALAPIMVFWFGWSFIAIILPTALMIFFPLTMNIYQGLRSTPQHLKEYFRCHKATKWQLFCKLQLPYALPHIFAGFRISTAIAGIGAVAGEWAGAQAGLGVLMLESRRATDLSTTFGALFCLTLMSFIFYGMVALLERQCILRKFIRSNTLLIFLMIGMQLMLTSCDPPLRQPKVKETRILLDWLPNPNHVPLYVGIEKGFFHNAGIQLLLLKIQDPSESIPFLSTGRADLAVYYSTEMIRGNARGAQLKPIGILIEKRLNCLIYRKGEGIETIRDLSNKILGYSSNGAESHVLRYLFDQNQIKPKELRNVTFDLVGALGTKQVDVIFEGYWNIEIEHLRALGVEADYLDLSMFGYPEYYELIFVAKENSPQAEKPFIDAFKSSLQKSLDYCVKFPEEAFEIYAKHNPDKSDFTLDWEKKAWLKTIPLLAHQQQIDDQLLKTLENKLKEYGFMD